MSLPYVISLPKENCPKCLSCEHWGKRCKDMEPILDNHLTDGKVYIRKYSQCVKSSEPWKLEEFTDLKEKE